MNTSYQNITNKSKTNDFEVICPPDDSVSALEFSPDVYPDTYLVAGSWDGSLRCWQVEQSGKTVPKSMKILGAPILDVCWSDDGTNVFMAGCDNQVNMWNLGTDQVIQVGAHDKPVKTCHWIKAPNYTCIMTGSWDKTLKFWDTRTPTPMLVLNLPERVYCADVSYPQAVVGTAYQGLLIYTLQNGPQETKRYLNILKYQHRTIRIFKDKANSPAGYAVGSIEGRVSIQYFEANQGEANFVFKCHRSKEISGVQDVYAVNDIATHPQHGTLATAGSDGTFTFWDKNTKTLLKTSDPMDQSITKCTFSPNGQIFAYALGYDWSKGYQHFNPDMKPRIFLNSCYNDAKPTSL